MLYLEDFLELVEHLPMEMREKLTEMRENDLEVSNKLDTLEENVKVFFKKCQQSNIKREWRDEQFKKIKTDYYEALEDTDQKVQLANHIYELVDRHSRRLDQELQKFKMELEADNSGITEILEKRSLELDKPPPGVANHKSEKRRLLQTQSSVTNHSDKRPATEVLSSLANEVVSQSFGPRRPNSTSGSPAAKMFSSGSGSGLSYTLGNIGAGNPAIAAAAAQAVAATQQMSQGRRTSSMKASYDLIKNPTVLPKDLTLNVNNSVSAPSTPEPAPRSQRQKKKTDKAAALAAAQNQNQATATAAANQTVTPAASNTESEDVSGDVQVDEWNADPNEPRYCLCNQVSYGDMVGCDNNDCPIEWFHYGCVSLTQAPKGKWYCPQCTAAMKRRGRR